MATTVSFQTIAEDIINEMEAGRQPRVLTSQVVDADPAISSLALTSEAYSSADVNRYDGVNLYFAPLAADTGTLIYASKVTRGGFTTGGTFTFSPSVGGTGWDATNARNIWFMRGYRREDILQAVNRVLASIYSDAYLPLGLLTDGDMEASGVTSWTDAVGTPTQTKETSIVLTGRQSLKLVIATVDHAVTSASLPVTEQEVLALSAFVKCTAGSLRVSLWDVTGAAEIEGVTVDEEAWTHVNFQDSVPANSHNVAVRLVGKTTNTTAYVDHVSPLSMNRSVYDLPSAVTDLSYLEGVEYLPTGFSSEANYAYAALTEQMRPWPWNDDLRDWRAVNSQRIVIEKPPQYPLFLRFKRTLPALSADSDTTTAPELLVVEGALSELKAALAQKRDDSKLRTESIRHARTFHAMLDHLGMARPIPRMKAQYRVAAPSR